ncbi:MAG: phosphatase PAP2 family protein [Deltaproteobacteria bacterium]|nr:phosphatase PAP2 family protein [Deltaproteobacteria bacterium]
MKTVREKQYFALLIVAIYNCLLLPQLAVVQKIDQIFYEFLTSVRTVGGISWMSFISELGGTATYLVFLALVILFCLMKRNWRALIWSLVFFNLMKFGNYWIKLLVARPRPPDGMLELQTYSMPSGHAANAILIYGTLWIFLYLKTKNVGIRCVGFIFGITIIFAISLSRMYLGVHYLSDVLMGMLWTTLMLALAFNFFAKRLSNPQVRRTGYAQGT